uniref:UDP glucuronosyltransferase 5 family, polypeptide D1 n=1 Tax=Poecilia mexicana TaxID=48701 RepID=A0A3B3Y1X2_9TELE
MCLCYTVLISSLRKAKSVSVCHYRHLGHIFFLVFAVFLSWRVGHGGRILIVPLEGSHWVNMDIMIQALHSRGHSIDVIRTNKSWYIKDDSPYYKTITVPVARSSVMSFLSLQVEMFKAMFDMHGMMCEMASTMLEDKRFMNGLKAKKYDLVMTDPAWGAGIMLAHALKLPLVYNVRWVTSGEGHLALAPSPLSYIPMTGSGLTDKMTFIQRVKNLLFYTIWEVQDTFLISPQYQAICNKFFGPDVRYSDLLREADLWLMRVDFVFEFPRPTMPNAIYIGGFQCEPAKPLPKNLEEFVQSSGQHGVIIMSLGTFVSELPSDVTNKIIESCSGNFHDDFLLTEVAYSTHEVLGPADESSVVKNRKLLCLALLYPQLFSNIYLKGNLCMSLKCFTLHILNTRTVQELLKPLTSHGV